MYSFLEHDSSAKRLLMELVQLHSQISVFPIMSIETFDHKCQSSQGEHQLLQTGEA